MEADIRQPTRPNKFQKQNTDRNSIMVLKFLTGPKLHLYEHTFTHFLMQILLFSEGVLEVHLPLQRLEIFLYYVICSSVYNLVYSSYKIIFSAMYLNDLNLNP